MGGGDEAPREEASTDHARAGQALKHAEPCGLAQQTLEERRHRFLSGGLGEGGHPARARGAVHLREAPRSAEGCPAPPRRVEVTEPARRRLRAHRPYLGLTRRRVLLSVIYVCLLSRYLYRAPSRAPPPRPPPCPLRELSQLYLLLQGPVPVVDEGIDDAGDREYAPHNGAHAREEVQEGGLLLVVDHLERRDVVEEEDPWQPVGVDLLQDALVLGDGELVCEDALPGEAGVRCGDDLQEVLEHARAVDEPRLELQVRDLRDRVQGVHYAREVLAEGEPIHGVAHVKHDLREARDVVHVQVPLVEAAPGCEVEVPRDLVHHYVPIEHAPFPQLLHHLGVDSLPLALLDRLDLRQRPALTSIGVRHLLAGVAALPGIPRPVATPALLPVLRCPRRPP